VTSFFLRHTLANTTATLLLEKLGAQMNEIIILIVGVSLGALACYGINRYNSSKQTKALDYYKEKWKIKTDEK